MEDDEDDDDRESRSEIGEAEQMESVKFSCACAFHDVVTSRHVTFVLLCAGVGDVWRRDAIRRADESG